MRLTLRMMVLLSGVITTIQDVNLVLCLALALALALAMDPVLALALALVPVLMQFITLVLLWLCMRVFCAPLRMAPMIWSTIAVRLPYLTLPVQVIPLYLWR